MLNRRFFCKDWNITVFQSMLQEQPFHSPWRTKRKKHLASNCSRQGDSLILHIPVFTISLVLLIMIKDDIKLNDVGKCIDL